MNGYEIIRLLDKGLLKEVRDEKNFRFHGSFRPSLFGRCFRMQYWSRKCILESDPIPVKTLRVFKLGDMIHTLLQEQLDLFRCEQEFKEDDVVFHPDYFDDNRVYDFKSIRSYAFKLITKPKYDIVKDKLPYILQVMAEALWLKRNEGELIFVDKDSLQTNLDLKKPFVFKTIDWKGRVEEELETLRDFWKNEQLPAPSPRAYNGRECQYCCYQTKCKEVERVF